MKLEPKHSEIKQCNCSWSGADLVHVFDRRYSIDYVHVVHLYSICLYSKNIRIPKEGDFLKITKINSQQEKSVLPFAKISSHKTQKIAHPQN